MCDLKWLKLTFINLAACRCEINQAGLSDRSVPIICFLVKRCGEVYVGIVECAIR